jgi:two-component system sensor histidine kinase GlrK
VRRLYRPQSFFSLLLTSFFFVALPLVVALVSSMHILESVTQQGTDTVIRSVARHGNCKKIAELLQEQERSARLYAVLDDNMLLHEVEKNQQELAVVVRQSLPLNVGNTVLDELMRSLLEQDGLLVERLRAVVDLPAGDAREQQVALALAGYERLTALVRKLEKESNAQIEQEVEQMKKSASRSTRALMWLVSGLLLFSVVLAMLFVSLILKPVHQLDQGIERLGEGNFVTPIEVAGPRDLEAIGEKLDWLRKRLATLDREKIRMVAHISHELKTPLASIREGVGLLKEEVVGPLTLQQVEVVTILDGSCDKLQTLIQAILDFNMVRARSVPEEVRTVPLAPLVAGVAEEHSNSLKARNIAFNIEVENATVLGDEKQLRVVVDNLLGNAAKYTPDDGVIGISLKKKNNQVTILVTDSGPGVPPEERAHIFAPFFQGRQRSMSAVRGSGLGLAISKEYVENAGGALRLLPGIPGQGARFLVTLPAGPERVEDELG